MDNYVDNLWISGLHIYVGDGHRRTLLYKTTNRMLPHETILHIFIHFMGLFYKKKINDFIQFLKRFIPQLTIGYAILYTRLNKRRTTSQRASEENMKTINGQTKRGQAIYYAWFNGERVSRISDIYGRYSWDKEKAFEDCFNAYCNEKSGSYGFKCTGHNSFAFSVAWMQEDGNLRYETSGGSYLVILNK